MFGSLGVFTSCATPTSLTKSGLDVKIIGPLSPANNAAHAEVCVVECHVGDQSLKFDESCKNEMRNLAGARGGQYIVIESRDQTFCVDSLSPNSRPCGIRMIGRVYRRK